MTKTQAVYFRHTMRRQGSLEKTVMLGKLGGINKRGRPNRRWIESIKEAIGTRLRELSKAGEDGTWWTLLIYRVSRSQRQLNGI